MAKERSAMHGLDRVILSSAIFSFIIFLIVHLGTFRFMDRQNILKVFPRIFLFGWVVSLAIIFIFWPREIFISGSDSIVTYFIVIAFDLVIYGLMCFLYVLYIFGPYESSIRFRLVYELFQNHPLGMTCEEIEKKYNPDIFLKRRLDRLLASGDLLLDKENYCLAGKRNIFIVLDDISLNIKKIIMSR